MDDSERVKKRLSQLKEDAKRSGYILNSDEEFLELLTKGLITNDDRYGMESCPCRRFQGEKEDNLLISYVRATTGMQISQNTEHAIVRYMFPLLKTQKSRFRSRKGVRLWKNAES